MFKVLYAGIATNDNSKARKRGLVNDSHFDFRLSSEAWSSNQNGGIDQSLVSDSKNLSQIQIRLQQLESKLSSTISLLNSKNAVMSTKVLIFYFGLDVFLHKTFTNQHVLLFIL